MKNRLAKVICWRFLSITTTFLTIFFITGDIKSTTSLTLLLHFLLITFHFVFEYLWDYNLESKKDQKYDE